ncbi:MAG: hypothetical protein IPP40_12750 [bacterium]|nr:hypothetical protein [bacterium]
MGRNILALCIVPLLIIVSACEEDTTEPTVGNPTITLLTPTENELSGVVTVEVFGHDAEGNALDRVVYFVDDVAMYTDPNPSASSPSSTWEWNSESVSDGDYEIKAVGYDLVGRSSEAAREFEVTNADAASGVVRSDQMGVIRTRHGAQVRVPLGAVPLGEDQHTAAMVFSVSRDTSATTPPPAGQTRVSNYYRFTPGGFVFRYPVEVTLPILEGSDLTGREVTIYRINPTSGELENFAGTIDEEFGTISAQTYELSTWFAAVSNSPGVDPQGWSCIQVSTGSDDWVSLCVENYLLAFPSRDQLFMPQNGLTAVYGRSQFGWTDAGRWFLPQGTYTICMQRLDDDGIWQKQSRSIVLNQPAGRTWDGGASCSAEWTSFLMDGSIPIPSAGSCGCIPEASVPVGTGEVQVTLQWFNEASIDLDLWVYEPSGERCYFGHTTTATGGRLDRDNLCGNYENGTPENIFWQTAPDGEFSIWVDWWSDCGNNIPQMPFNIRLVNGINVETFDRVLGSEQSLEVAQFQVHHGALHIAPPGGLFQASPPPHVEKREGIATR